MDLGYLGGFAAADCRLFKGTHKIWSCSGAGKRIPRHRKEWVILQFPRHSVCSSTSRKAGGGGTSLCLPPGAALVAPTGATQGPSEEVLAGLATRLGTAAGLAALAHLRHVHESGTTGTRTTGMGSRHEDSHRPTPPRHLADLPPFTYLSERPLFDRYLPT